MRITRSLVIGIVAAALSTTSLVGTATARPAIVAPKIGDAAMIQAPIGKPGAIMTPYVECSDYTVDPDVTSTITNTKTGWKRTYSWTGSLPGYGFPRTAVGPYEVRTTAYCGEVKKTRVQEVRVTEKTRARTVSAAEWHKIKRGMTVKRVTRIIGYAGVYGGRYGHTTTRTYDMMDFWAFSVINFKDGRVIRKFWDVDHD